MSKSLKVFVLSTFLIVGPAFAQQVRNDDGTVAFAQPPLHLILRPLGATPTGIFPAQMVKSYGFSGIVNQGAGQTIGIVDAFDAPTIEADLAVFNTQFGLAACTTANGCFQKVYAAGTPPAVDAGWSLETSLDVEWAHAIAPQAKILLVEGATNSFTNLLAAVDVAVAHGASVVSMSFGGPEFSAELQQDSHFNVPFVTFVASSGDNGHGASYPAASPFVVGVGGTSLTIQSDGTYVSETAWNGSGGGTSRFEPKPQNQVGLVFLTQKRSIPDIAYDADPNTGVPVYDTTGGKNWIQVGGTSSSAPQWSALFAIANSSRAAAGKAALNGVLDNLYNLTQDLNDVTTGTNGICGRNCKTKHGYDKVTGLGTPMADQLIPDLVAIP